jgi:carbonic anhydrase
MDIKKIFSHNREWINKRLAVDKDYFKKLSKGQNPKVLYIGCSDSRVAAEELLGAEPGELFVHRNIANMVISIDLDAISVITYAVETLKVSHIIVCGHYLCGGIQAATEAKDFGLLNPWLKNIRDVYQVHKKELNTINDPDKRHDRLVELNVEEQCINLMKIAVVQKACKEKKLQVHGWVFDIRSGKLIDLKTNFKKILNDVLEIYDLG